MSMATEIRIKKLEVLVDDLIKEVEQLKQKKGKKNAKND